MSLLKYCRNEFSDAKITLILKSTSAALAAFLTDADEIIVLSGQKTNSYGISVKYGLKLRNSFDVVICTNTPRKTNSIFVWLLNPKNSIAYVKNNWHGRLIKTRLPFIKSQRAKKHCALETLNLLLPCDSIPASCYRNSQ